MTGVNAYAAVFDAEGNCLTNDPDIPYTSISWKLDEGNYVAFCAPSAALSDPKDIQMFNDWLETGVAYVLPAMARNLQRIRDTAKSSRSGDVSTEAPKGNEGDTNTDE